MSDIPYLCDRGLNQKGKWMRPADRVRARKNLDKRLSSLRSQVAFARPPRGWVKAIREAASAGFIATFSSPWKVFKPRTLRVMEPVW